MSEPQRFGSRKPKVWARLKTIDDRLKKLGVSERKRLPKRREHERPVRGCARKQPVLFLPNYIITFLNIVLALKPAFSVIYLRT